MSYLITTDQHIFLASTCANPEWGQGVRTPLYHKNTCIGFLSNTGPDPLKNHKATKPAFNMDHHLPTSETPFQWRFAAGSMMARFKCYLDHSSPHQSPPPPKKKKKKKKKRLQSFTPSDKTIQLLYMVPSQRADWKILQLYNSAWQF